MPKQEKFPIVPALLVGALVVYVVLTTIRALLPNFNHGQQLGLGVLLLGAGLASVSFAEWALRRRNGTLMLLDLVIAGALTALGYSMVLPSARPEALPANALLFIMTLSAFARLRVKSGRDLGEREKSPKP